MTSALILFRQSYARHLADSVFSTVDWLEIRGILGNVTDVVPILQQEDVDVLIIGPTFIESAHAVLVDPRVGVRPRVVVLERQHDPSVRVRATQYGVDAVFTLSGGLTAMLDELRAFVVDSTPRQPVHSGQVGATEHPAPVLHVTDETDREIVRLVAAGLTDREIAETVFLSHQTVRNRVSRILCHTGVRNRTHMACIYLALLHDGTSPFIEIS